MSCSDMFIEDLLLPLQQQKANRDGEAKIDPKEAISTLSSLLETLASKPISARDRRLLKNAVIDFLSFTNIKDKDPNIEHRLAIRFSYEYLPLAQDSMKIAVQAAENPASKESETNHQNLETIVLARALGTHSDASSHNDDTIKDGDPSAIVSRIVPGYLFQCSVYRHRSTLSTSYRMVIDAILPSSTSLPQIVLSSRIRKGGMIQGCSIWITNDSKNWKEKNIFAKISRTNTIYSLHLQPQSQHSSISSKAVIPTSSSEGEDGSERTHPSLSSSTATQIVISVRSNGPDKLLQINAIASLNTIDESKLWKLLHGMNDVNRIVPLGESSPKNATNGHILMKNKLPRKATMNAGTDVHAVDFGPTSRIRVPSRKNIALERLDTNSIHWEADARTQPLFQFGKIDEDLFAMDFMELSPLQAFAIALSIFDQ